MRKIVLTLLFCGVVSAALTPEEQAALNRISAASMRGHLSFLASDLLEGRATPSRGQDVAAEYIAAQFRRAGLEPAAPNGSYFQTAVREQIEQQPASFQLTWKAGAKQWSWKAADVLTMADHGIDLTDATVMPLAAGDISGKIVAADAEQNMNRRAIAQLRARKPALILLFRKGGRVPLSATQLVEPGKPAEAPVVLIFGEPNFAALASAADAKLSIHLPEPLHRKVNLRNVAAILRGSDPELSKQYLIFSAHYDHIGMKDSGDGDRIFNGANDNGSGTVSVVEIGAALATLPVHPRRSILFMTFFGEELGLLGAYYYTQHPLVPLQDTIANINLEQMGRTDEQDGKQINSYSFTGPSFSNIPKILGDAAKQEDIKIWAKNGADAFFGRSDNYAFAQAGIPAHTAVVAYEYPDYHGLGDEWEKVDYENMARVDKGLAAGLLALANAPERPQWNDIPATAEYRKAKP